MSEIRWIVNICVGLSAMLLGCLLEMSFVGIVIIMVGAISIGEFYSGLGKSMQKRTGVTRWVWEELLVLVACASVLFVTNAFEEKTLLSLNFSMHWGSRTVTLGDFCFLTMLLTVVAVAGPTLLVIPATAEPALGYISGGLGPNPFDSLLAGIKSWGFFLSFQTISILLAACEVFVREQAINYFLLIYI